jgi:hypothetical protein
MNIVIILSLPSHTLILLRIRVETPLNLDQRLFQKLYYYSQSILMHNLLFYYISEIKPLFHFLFFRNLFSLLLRANKIQSLLSSASLLSD